MLFWLLQELAPVLDRMDLHPVGDSRVYLTARAAIASVTAFLAAIVGGPAALRLFDAFHR